MPLNFLGNWLKTTALVKRNETNTV